MKKRPRYYFFIAYFLTAIIICFPLQIMLIFEYSLQEFYLTFDKLTFMNWAVMSISALCIYYSLKVDIRLNYAVLFLIGLVVLNNYLVGRFATDYSPDQTVLATTCFIAPFSLLLRSKYQLLLVNREMHWWKTAIRYEKNIPIEIEGFNQSFNAAKNAFNTFNFHTINISKTGALIQLSCEKMQNTTTYFTKEYLLKHTFIALKLNFSNKKMNITGRVLRLHEENGNIRFAVNFENINFIQRFMLKSEIT